MNVFGWVLKTALKFLLSIVLADKFDGERKNTGAKKRRKNFIGKLLDIERMNETKPKLIGSIRNWSWR